MKIPIISRLMDIKEEQLRLETMEALHIIECKHLLREILKEMKGGYNDGKNTNKNRRRKDK